jgi:hypothetical protein
MAEPLAELLAMATRFQRRISEGRATPEEQERWQRHARAALLALLGLDSGDPSVRYVLASAIINTAESWAGADPNVMSAAERRNTMVDVVRLSMAQSLGEGASAPLSDDDIWLGLEACSNVGGQGNQATNKRWETLAALARKFGTTVDANSYRVGFGKMRPEKR